jgi:gp16 family phage-associated protein
MDAAPDNTISTERLMRVKRQFAVHGISVTQWALYNRFSPALVHAILANKRRCVRGESFRIAVKLGIKEAPDEPMPAWLQESEAADRPAKAA